jgi:hypothetical protein
MTIPKEQKASVIQQGQTLKIETIAVPLLAGEHEILIKVTPTLPPTPPLVVNSVFLTELRMKLPPKIQRIGNT